MLIMINANEKIQPLLQRLGQRLREARLARNESQEVFAARIGVTRQSLGKMEKGSAVVPIGCWLAASDILGRLQTWEEVLAESEDLFEQFENKKKTRRRAGSKRAGKK
jgi:transcriptional regulator with XRE-family HTH domain